MRRDAIAVVAVVVLLLALEAGTGQPGGYTGPDAAVLVDPTVSEPRAQDAAPVAWHPLFTAEGTAGPLFVDPARDRLTFGAALGPDGQRVNRLLTVDRDGTVLGNLSWDGAPFAVDPVTGGVFQSHLEELWTPPCRCDREVWSLDPNAPAWDPLGLGSPRRGDAGLGYDSRAHRTVLSDGETWSFNASMSRWDLRGLNEGPDAMQAMRMVYDDRANRFVVSGYPASSEYEIPTWMSAYDFQNDTWTRIAPPSTGYTFVIAAMTYDNQADKVIVLNRSPYLVNDTWTYDLLDDTWTLMTPERSPPMPWESSMVYDSRADRVILFGGYGDEGPYNDTWSYDVANDTWTAGHSLSSPPARARSGMAYDPRSDRVILFGGYGDEGPYNDTWSYDVANDTWTPMRRPAGLTADHNPALTYDASLDRILLFGGGTGETWLYDTLADEWTLANPGTPASPSGMVYDSESNRVELFGEVWPEVSGLTTIESEVWSFDPDAATWSRMDPPPSGPKGQAYGLAYDSGSDRTLRFGGQGYYSSFTNETWAYDDNSNTWDRRSPGSGPSPRSRAAMAYDAGSDRVVLFGGYGYVDVNGTQTWTQFNDTWVYDYASDTWALQNPPMAPSPLEEGIMAYDSGSDRVILIGGRTSSWSNPETWSYDTANNTWTRMSPAIGPVFSGKPAAAYDAALDRLLVFGGGTNETWSYDLDHDSWTSVETDRVPCPRSWGSMVYDDALDRAFLFGGWSTVSQWSYVRRTEALDPVSGAVVAGPWTLPPDLAALAFGRKYIYAGGPGIAVINRTTGRTERTIDPLRVGWFESLVADPTEGWLVGLWRNSSDGAQHAFRFNLTDGTFDVLPATPSGTLTLSADGRILFVCTMLWNYDPSTALEAYWLANGSLRSRSYCAGGVRNPVTGVEALASGALAADGHAFESIPVDPRVLKCQSPPSWGFGSMVWTEDGKEFAGIARYYYQNDLFQVGLWAGAPYVSNPPSVLPLSTSNWSLLVRSVGGFNGTTMRVSIDGGPYPFTIYDSVIGVVKLDLGRVPDGTHTLRVTGWDLLGQWMDEMVSWIKDRTVPGIRILSSMNPTSLPYSLYGVVEDVSLSSVRVNGVDAFLDDVNWSLPLGLVIGNNSFGVDATDLANLRSNVSGVIRYWPLHDRIVTSDTYHVSVAGPPDWLVSVGSLGNVSLNLVLMEPTSDGAPAFFSVQTQADAFVNDMYAYVWKIAQYREDLLHSLGSTITQAVHPDTVDGRVAASFEVTGYSLGYPARSVVTVVASEEWHLVYVLTMTVPQARLTSHPETRAWILEEFHISSPPPPLALPPIPEPWPFVGLGITGVVCAAGIAWTLWSERRPRRRQVPKGA